MKNKIDANLFILTRLFLYFSIVLAILINLRFFYIDLLAYPGNFLTPLLTSFLFLFIAVDFTQNLAKKVKYIRNHKLIWIISIYVFLTCSYFALLFFSFNPKAIVLLSTVGIIFYGLLLLLPLFVLSYQTYSRLKKDKNLCLVNSSSKLIKFAVTIVSIILLLVSLYSIFIEPYNIEITHYFYDFDNSVNKASLKIVHLTDIQTDFLTKREKETVNIVNKINPDIIVITGDYYNGNFEQHPKAFESARFVLENVRAKYGVFTVSSDCTRYTDHEVLFKNLPITYLKNESVKLEVDGRELYIVGIDRHHENLNNAFSQVPEGTNTLVLYHGPEIYFDETFQSYSPDLLLVGHTHGGQVAFPFLGPLTSATSYGSKYAKGWFREFGTTMYVNRGLGMDGWGAPKIRFLARPEIAVIQATF